MYRCEFADARQLIRHLRVHCIPHGYRFYVTGTIPAHKDPATTDSKIIHHYGLDISKWARGRRKKRGLANVHYLRHGHFFILIATRGAHAIFTDETLIENIRRKPICCFGQSIGMKSQRAFENSDDFGMRRQKIQARAAKEFAGR
jgi:hypothetical protein